jgi:hypothetical protein
MHDGALALSIVESNGIKIDEKYLDLVIANVEKKIEKLTSEFKVSKEYGVWKNKYKDKSNFSSRLQLGDILFNELGIEYPVDFKTATGRYSTDDSVLERIDHKFVKTYLKIAKLEKTRGTYLSGIKREVWNGFIHPSFNLHTVSTFRSCVAKGTFIEVVRNLKELPFGVKIEDIKAGDYVYCYDDQKCDLAIRKVLWAGRTGRKKVVKVYWSTSSGRKGSLIVTPDHKIRISNGDYVRADALMSSGDFRGHNESRRVAKKRVLSLSRDMDGDRIYPTGRKVVLDHRFVYEQLIGSLEKHEVVHHKDGNHLNNNISNLEKMSLPDHSRLHQPRSLTREAILRGNAKVVQKWRIGELKAKTGSENKNWLDISKFKLLRILANSSGKSSRTEYDFGTIENKAKFLGIDLEAVKIRYGGDGRYISLGRLKKVHTDGLSKMASDLGINFYKAKKLLKQRGISTKRRWANQFGSFIPNNHTILKVEWLDQEVDVYDIEIEESHNFIANGICVHNSSNDPNFQNIPIRDPKIGKLIRRCFIPRSKDHVLAEIDFKSIEVKISSAYNQDPVLIAYINDPTKDMHRDMAAQCYMLDPEEIDKQTRYCAKNMFVFPEFYGSVYFQCAPILWEALTKHRLCIAGTEIKIKDHLVGKGITHLGDCSPNVHTEPNSFVHHIRTVEHDFWNRRFKVYKSWKENWWKRYLESCEFQMLTGFVERGVYSRNDVINHPVQGAAFHCLLWSLIGLQNWLNDNKMKSVIIGQIHDSIIADVLKSELQDYLNVAKKIMTEDIRKHWNWLIVPLDIEAEIAETNWYEKLPWKKKDGIWEKAS